MRYYDRNGDRLGDVLRWERRVNEPEYRHVALTTLTTDADPDVSVTVCTVWTGVDFADAIPRPERQPMIFETATYFQSMKEITTDRWGDENAARIGHAELVALLAATLPEATVTELDAYGQPATAATWAGAPLPPPLPAGTTTLERNPRKDL